MSVYQRGAEIAGRFVIEEPIGKGGMGAVYKAVQTSLGRDVALKVLHAQNAFTAKARRRFAREARAIARLNHPHIAAVYDFGVDEEEGALWLAMEYIEGHSLTQVKREPVDLVRILSLTDQILSALSAAHARGIVHRDLKPSNVIVSRDDEGKEITKLVDFGLAATMEGEGDLDIEDAPGIDDPNMPEEERRALLGTPRYMAPELFRRQPADPRVDLYALGVILFELLAGRPPFIGDDPKVAMKNHLFSPIPKLEARGGVYLPPDVEQCVYGLLAKDPRERFQAATEVRELVAAMVNEFSFVPGIAMGPRNNDATTFHLAANSSTVGIDSSLGGQTLAPAALHTASISRFGSFNPQNTPLVGRLEERRALEGPIKAALRDDQGAVVLLEGEPGVGKTRLMDWICVRVKEAGVMRVARGAYSRRAQGFAGIRMVLEDVLGTADFVWSDVPYAIEHKLKRWGFSREEINICLQLMSPGEVGDAFAVSASVTDQERIFAVVDRIMRRAAQDRPLLIALEDIHDAGEATIGFLEFVAVGLQIKPAPVLFIATTRTPTPHHARLAHAFERVKLFGKDGLRSLKIPRLPLRDGAKLVQQLLITDEDLAQRVVTRASGNPRHIIQILQFLIETEKLEKHQGEWALKPDVQLTREIPGEIADMMRQRADLLMRGMEQPEVARALLERLAILGRSFSYRMLRRYLEAEPGQPTLAYLDRGLEMLLRHGILRDAGGLGGELLVFDHEIMRDVLLQDTTNATQSRLLHQLAAETKLVEWGASVSSRALEIAEHYAQADMQDEVYHFTLEAARSALSGSDLRGAMQLFQQAEDLRRSLAHVEPLAPAPRGAEIALEVAHLERRLGEYDAARQHYKHLLDHEQIISLWARWGLGELAYRQGDYDESSTWYETARRQSLEALQYDSAVAPEVAHEIDAHCLFGLACITAQRGDLKAARITLTETLDRARKIQRRGLEVEVLHMLAEITWRTGDMDGAEIYLRRATMLAEDLQDHEAIAYLSSAEASYLLALGKPRLALERANLALERFEEIGKRHHAAFTTLTLGMIDWRSGDNRNAAQHYRKAHRSFEMFRDRRGLTLCKRLLAELALSIRRFPDAQTLIRDALEGYKAMGDRRGEALSWFVVGRLERELMKHTRAARTFGEARRVLSSLGDERMALCALALQTLSIEESGDRDLADEHLDTLLPLLREHEVFEEAMIFALDQLARRLKPRRPGASMDLEQHVRHLSNRLGIPQERAAII